MPGTHHRVVTFALFAALFAAIAPAALAAEEAAPNLVRNPGFEEGAKPWSLPKGFEVVEAASSHSGAHGLHFTRQDATTYDLASQRIDFRPGARYLFSAWVRTKGVVGPESGATVCMEWSGPKGWIGGTYPDGRKGDADWFQVTGVTPPIPKEATSVAVTLYLRRGMTGEAWFDDVRVTEYAARPLEAYLIDPAYRGLIFADEPPDSIRVHVDLAEFLQGHRWRPEGGYEWLGYVKIDCTVVRLGNPFGTGPDPDSDGGFGRLHVVESKLFASKDLGYVESRTNEIALSPVPADQGEFSVFVSSRGMGATGGDQQIQGSVVPAGKRPRVYIDRHRRTIVEGKPFFPLGFYLGTIQDADLEKMAAAGFNCVMPYAFSSMPMAKAGELLDVAQRRGIKVIYSVKDLYAGTNIFPKGGIDGITDADAAVRTIVERFRSHPAVLAWYLNDELPATMRRALEARYRLVRGLDPDHPTWAVLFQVDELADYRHTCDVLGTDPYPIPDRPVTMAGDWARKTRDATGGACAFWQVPQVFDWANYHKNEPPEKQRAPTYDEMRAMTYLALAGGAKGLIYYSFFDLQRDRLGFDARWKDVSRLGEEMRSLMPALLAADAPPPEVKVGGGPAWAAFRDGKRLWVLVTNPEKLPATMRLAVPAGVGSVKTVSGRTLAVRDGTIVEELKPLACETYMMELP
jgi:hypothetical protein